MTRTVAGLLALFALLVSVSFAEAASTYRPRTGDLVFHTSRSRQSRAVQAATGSRWSHMGLVVVDPSGTPWVWEAVGPVKRTRLSTWRARGTGFLARRLEDADAVMTPAAEKELVRTAKQLAGRPYDLWFGWSDTYIYCSELAWKAYHRALGLEVGERETLGDFDLSAPGVAALVKQRYPQGVPTDEPVISPKAMAEADGWVDVVRDER